MSLARLPPDPDDHRDTADQGERLAGQPGRTVARWYNRYD
jgi:hypothetical protein